MIRRTILPAIALLFLRAPSLPAAEPRDNEATKHLQHLQGTWKQVLVSKGGEQVAAKQSAIVEGAVMTFIEGDAERIKFDIKLDAVPDPKQIDLFVYSTEKEKQAHAAAREARKRGENVKVPVVPRAQGLYGFNGDYTQFVLVFNPPGEERPTEMSSSKGSQTMLMMFRKVKDELAGDLKRLQGIWKQAAVFVSAQPRPPRHTVIVKENEMALMEGDTEAMKFELSLNSGENPKTVDLTIPLSKEQKELQELAEKIPQLGKDAATFKKLSMKGIYFIGKMKETDTEERFILSFRELGKERPTEFSSKEGDGIIMMIMERQK